MQTSQSQPQLSSLRGIKIIMAYVTELGFYVFYIDCHHVTLTDRKKVVKPNSRVQKQMNAPASRNCTQTGSGCWQMTRSESQDTSTPDPKDPRRVSE